MRTLFSLLTVVLPLLASAAPPQSVVQPKAPQSVLGPCCPCDHCDCAKCQCNGGKVCPCPTCRIHTSSTPASNGEPGTWDVLEELNQQRKARGLAPYLWDKELTMAAGRASKWRAERLQFGHAPSDFAFLTPGVSADAAGCAAYAPSYGFMACACYEAGQYYAGAAYTLGKDGKRYCHLFIRRTVRALSASTNCRQ